MLLSAQLPTSVEKVAAKATEASLEAAVEDFSIGTMLVEEAEVITIQALP